MGYLGRDPEFFRYVEGRVSDRFLERTEYAFTELDPHKNPYLQYILLGNYTTALPRCYRPEHFDRMREASSRIYLYQGTVQDAAREHAARGLDGYNLSDIFEYLSEEISKNIYLELLGYAKPKARFAYWNMLVPRSHPEEASPSVTSLTALSEELFRKDLAFFYSKFIVEEHR
jgi:S-adenosylmethionine-diacylglycerol 3-amino-3-carboxypropyl transferase